MKKFSALILAFTLSSFCFTGCTEKTGNKSVVRLNEVTHSIFYAPLYVAIEKDFFGEENITLELTNGGGADKSMTAILSGAADIGLMGPEAAMYVYINGKENYPKVFAQLTKRDGSFLISRVKEDNFDYSNLSGKEIIAGRKGGVPAMTLQYVLNNKGYIDGQNITLNYDIQFNLTAAAFEGGTGDYCTLFEPTASEFQKAGKGYIVASVGSDSGEVPYTAFMALDDYIKNNPVVVKGFLRAIYKAISFLKTASKAEIAEALKGQFPTTSEESINNSIESYLKIDAWMTNMAMKKDAYERLQTIMTNAGELKGEAPYDKLVLTDYASEIYNEIIDK